MDEYMTLPPKLIPKEMTKAEPVILPIGTRIRFIKELSSGPDEDSPGNLYAEKDDLGEVTGHFSAEGHWVKRDKWKTPFGAVYGTEFLEAEA